MGYGDDIMVTGEVEHLLKKNPNSKFIVGDGHNIWWSEIYENNEAIINANQYKNFKNVLWINNYPHHRPYRIYEKDTHYLKYTWNKSYKAKKGKLFFSNEEKKFANKIFNKIKTKSKKKIILVEPNVKIKKGYKNRDWGFNKWQFVVDKLREKFIFLQTSYSKQQILKNTINIHNINFRSSCAILSKADLFIGTEGGLHHAAAALNKKAVVIFGGFIDPSITGYSFHNNLYIDDLNSPCGSKHECKHCKNCMDLITIDKVIKEINKLIKYKQL